MTRQLALSLVLLLAPGVTAVSAQEPFKLTVQTSQEHGSFIADAQGRALYMFEADTRGEGQNKAVSTCFDACAEAWPPLIVGNEPAGGEEVQADLIDSVARRDGDMQATYGGWPLYYYVRDQGPGMTTGHDIEDFGAEWYLVTPEGEKLDEH